MLNLRAVAKRMVKALEATGHFNIVGGSFPRVVLVVCLPFAPMSAMPGAPCLVCSTKQPQDCKGHDALSYEAMLEAVVAAYLVLVGHSLAICVESVFALPMVTPIPLIAFLVICS